MITIPMKVSVSSVTIPMSVTSAGQTIPMSISAAYIGAPAFNGEYEYTPSQQTQTIQIEGYRATENIVINPIPNNYGLITWNGSTITVS